MLFFLPEDKHVDAVGREHHVEGVGCQPVHRGPAGQHHADGQQAPDEQCHHGGDGVDCKVVLGIVERWIFALISLSSTS